MRWEINDDEIPFGYEIDPTPLREVTGKVGSSPSKNRDLGILHPIDRSENKKQPKGHLPPYLIDLHQQLVRRFGIGNIVPFTEIEAYLLVDLDKFRIRRRLTQLWIEGYLDKYAKGIYMLAEQKYWRQKKNDWRGKYFGVHYQILEKEYL